MVGMVSMEKMMHEQGKNIETKKGVLETEKERIISHLKNEELHSYQSETSVGLLKIVKFDVKDFEEKIKNLENKWDNAIEQHDDEKLYPLFHIADKIRKEIHNPSCAVSRMFRYAENHQIKDAENDFDTIIYNAQESYIIPNRYLKKEEIKGIKYFLSKEIGSYLVRIKAMDVSHILRREKDITFTNFLKSKGVFQETPVDIDKDHHALMENNTMRLSKIYDADPITTLENGNKNGPFHIDIEPTGDEYRKAIQEMGWNILRPESLVVTGEIFEDQRNLQKDGDDFIYLHTAYARQQIQKDFHCNLSNLSLSEQFYFLNFVKNKEFNTIAPIKKFARTFGESGVRTFLALDFDMDLGDRIVSLGNNLEESAAKAIFTKFGDIIDAKENLSQYLQENFKKEATLDSAVINRITESLIKKGKDLLVHFADVLEREKGKGAIPDTSAILAELEDIKTDVVLFTSAFKTLKQGGESMDFNEIQQLSFENIRGNDFSPSDISHMHAMYEQNYGGKPELREKLREVFDKSLANPRTQFYTLRYKGDIISFVRFNEKDMGHLYAGSLNVDPHFRGSEIGRAVMEQTLDSKAKEAVLEADCSATDVVGAHYIETGFVATNFYDYAGAPSFAIERNDRMSYTTKKMSKEDLVKQAQHADDQPVPGEYTVITGNQKNSADLGFHLLDQGYVLTRYFTDGNAWYAAYEKKKEEDTVFEHKDSVVSQAA